MDDLGDFGRLASKRVVLNDARSGRKVIVAIDVTHDIMRIDGVEVVQRKDPFERRRPFFEFGAPGATNDVLIALDREQLNQVREMWGLSTL